MVVIQEYITTIVADAVVIAVCPSKVVPDNLI